MARPCEETAGFLFKHVCRAEAPGECAECDKAICGKHTKMVGSTPLCVVCAKLLLEEDAAKKQGGGSRGQGAPGNRRYRGYSDDPYFYGDSYYDGYGSYRRGHWGHDHYGGYGGSRHDGNDFTEADGQAFQAEADEGFEQDMGGS